MFGSNKGQEKENLNRAYQALSDVKRERNSYRKELEELEDLISWTEQMCHGGRYQFYGIRKFKHESRNGYFYLCFLLHREEANNEQNLRNYFCYQLRGYSAIRHNIIYEANFKQRLDHIPQAFESKIVLQTIETNPGFRKCGVGSIGLSYIKEFAKEMHCDEITAIRQPYGVSKEELPEAEEKLRNFYYENGFQQNDEDRAISFSLVED